MKTQTAKCRHGTFTWFADDKFVGASLWKYGDYSEDETYVFKKVLRPDDIAIEVGSNIGALTVPMARLCKKVYAFEPQPENYALLTNNLFDNDLTNKVSTFKLALGACIGDTRIEPLEHIGDRNYGRVEIGYGDITIAVKPLDDCIPKDETIRFIKIDAEGSELDILKGAEQLLKRCHPILYVENDRKEKSAELVGWLLDHNYRCFWHRPPLYYADNYRAERTNIFGSIISQNMVCVPDDGTVNIYGMDEVGDHRIDPLLYHRARDRALRRLVKEPEDFESRVLAAHYSNLMNDEKSARQYLRENLERDQNHAPSLAIIGLMELQSGNYKDGWQAYELRYAQLNPKAFGWRPHDVETWDGMPTNKPVLIWCEQGWGDSIMFSRFMREVLERAPKAIFECQPQLFELFELSKLVPKGQLFRLGRTLPEYDYHCSLPSVPATLKFDNEQQLRRGKYLYADATMVEGWKKRGTPRIGICLRGGAISERAYSRDMPDEIGEQLARRFGPFMTLTHDGQWESYADTAAAIEALDLVLTVDTSVAHLSGALGVRTILMLSSDPDWRWQKKRRDCPWYPSMTICRQNSFMDWSNVIDEVTAELELKQAAE